ncbi:MAG: glycosyltransferase [Rhodothermales bacterium]|nr:glycosyltransferase [Rhodothermales bacterium]
MVVVLFVLHAGGHYGQHVHELLKYWTRERLPGTLHVVISPALWASYPEVQAFAGEAKVHIHIEEESGNISSPVRSGINHIRSANRWIRRLSPTHFVFLFLDHIQPFSRFLRLPAGGMFSGILFRPSLHFDAIGAPARTLNEKASRFRRRANLRLLVGDTRLSTIFSLDPYAVGAINALSPRREVCVALPEPLGLLDISESPALLRRVKPWRKTLLLFGALDMRKGLVVLLDAIEGLPQTAQKRLTLILAGKLVDERLRTRVQQALDHPHLQVLFEDRFLDETEIQPLIEAVDLNVLPYVGHLGSSGVLVRAAHAGKPVIASDYGVVGTHVNRHGLGRTVDTNTPGALTEAIGQWLEHPETLPYDAVAAAHFAEANTGEAFARTLFNRL